MKILFYEDLNIEINGYLQGSLWLFTSDVLSRVSPVIFLCEMCTENITKKVFSVGETTSYEKLGSVKIYSIFTLPNL